MLVIEVVGAIAAGGALVLWVVVKLTRSLWSAAWRQLQAENAEAARLARIQREAEALRHCAEEQSAVDRAAARQELDACLRVESAESEAGAQAPQEAVGRAVEPCQEKPVDHL